ncbi:MAG: type II toxin-antitoxin system VapB family antitoxin [Planctomycetaceae bacterium]|nr:type II toxin-antitoxin system VapB family antitoxin [Planctomycetaceae bacterium]
MRATFELEESLVEDARLAGRHASREEAVRCALEEYVRRHRQEKIIELFGSVEFDESYDYKAARKAST